MNRLDNISRSFLTLMVLGLLFTALPTPTYASDPDSPIQVAHSIITSIETHLTAISAGVTAGNSTADFTRKNVLNPIAFQVGQRAIAAITKSTVNWINNGFNGSPAYVSDLKGTLLDAADQEAEKLFTQLKNNASIKSPFSDAVADDVRRNWYRSSSRDGFIIINPYTLNQVSSDDRAFQRGDFTKGGFQAWLTQTINPQNNWLGAKQIAESQLGVKVVGSSGTIRDEAQQSGGFLSWRKCDNEVTTGVDTSKNDSIPIFDENGKPTGKTQPILGVISLTPKKTCLSSHIETPGSVIANKLNQSLGLGAESLVQAKEFDQIINALMAQLINKVVGSDGLAGLSRSSATTGNRPYFDQTDTTSSAATSADTSVVTSFLQIVTGQQSQLQTFITNWQSINTAALEAKSALSQSTCMSNAQSVIDAQVTPVITQAASAIAEAQTDAASLNTINTQVLQSTGSGTLSAVNDAKDAYNALLPQLLKRDVNYAAAQAQDTRDQTPSSLLTQMNQLTTQARCGS